MAHYVIVSASVGAGHDHAAAELDRRLRQAGHRVDRYDFVELLPAPLGRLLSGGYRHQVQNAPWLWQATLTTFDRVGPAALAAAATRIADERVLATVGPRTAAVVSTYPLASQALGRLRRSGRLAVPAVTYLTDPYVHRTWIAAGVDGTLALHAATAGQASRLGARGVRLVAPLVAPGFRAPAGAAEIAAARRTFRLPPTGPLALVVAGSLGLGRPDRTAADVLGTGRATPVVVCGRYRTLHQRLTGVPGIVSLDWVDDMPTLMRAVDVVIHNAGGLTSLEALASGRPTLTYRPLAGHGRANAATLDTAGVIPWVRDRHQLADALDTMLDRAGGPAPIPAGPDPCAVLADLARARTAPPARRSALRAAPRTRRRTGQPMRPPTRSSG